MEGKEIALLSKDIILLSFAFLTVLNKHENKNNIVKFPFVGPVFGR